MGKSTIEAIAKWQQSMADNTKLKITFHGGEPLVAGIDFFRMALPLLREKLACQRVAFGLQSNLWMLTDEICRLFMEYGVSIGTSLDGPEIINDTQRGPGYYHRTMDGIERALKHGLDVGCICTFTAKSFPRTDEIFDFYVRKGLNFSIHACLPALQGNGETRWSLSAKDYGKLLVNLLDRYLVNQEKIRISTLDSMSRSLSYDKGSICTFRDCLGDFMAVGPNGSIYSCQRFVGIPEYRIGNVHADVSLEALSSSPVWRAFEKRQERIQEACGPCSYFKLCRGGCPYNVLASCNGSSGWKKASFQTRRDPYCGAYRHFFSHVIDRTVEEVFSENNLEAVVHHPNPEGGLLQCGKLLPLIRQGPHPYETATRARQILAAVALAHTCDPAEATNRFMRLALSNHENRTHQAMQSLYHRLISPFDGLNNLYLHVTFACPLRCSHCYAHGGREARAYLPVSELRQACFEAASTGFRQAVITGGEPLVHPQREEMLQALTRLRERVKPLLTVLRTSLALPMDRNLLQLVSHSTDETVISLDGDRETHDARRGAGSYDLTVNNLRALVRQNGTTKIVLSAVLPLEQIKATPGAAVQALSREIGLRRPNFRPILPIGRAADTQMDVVPETVLAHLGPDELMAYGFRPSATCGIGHNLYVEPDGTSFPCYVCRGNGWHLGRINTQAGISRITTHPVFRNLRKHTVDSNRFCKECVLRYLCGGACRAWNHRPVRQGPDLDEAPMNCTHMQKRSLSLMLHALDHLKIPVEKWLEAGLPVPKQPGS